jgi:hypothetical protein
MVADLQKNVALDATFRKRSETAGVSRRLG